MRVRTFQRRLQAEGINYTQVLEQVQLQEAKHYLEHSNETITNIGIGLGYSEVAHFSRAFKRLQGVSPSEFRQQLGHKPIHNNGE